MKNRPVSQKLQRRVLGLQSKFDPRRVGNMMAGSFGASSTYKLAGQKSQQQKASVNTLPNAGKMVGKLDTAEHTSISEDQTQRMKKGDGIADVIAKIVNFYKKSHEEVVLQKDLTRDFQKEEHENRKRRHEQLVKQLKGGKSGGAGTTNLTEKGTPLETVSKIGALERPELAERVASQNAPTRYGSAPSTGEGSSSGTGNILTDIANKVGSVVSNIASGVGSLAIGGVAAVGKGLSTIVKGGAPIVAPASKSVIAGAVGATISTKSVAELLKSGEGGDYNQLVYATPKGKSAKVPTTANLTSMTIAQVFALQDQMRDSGNYASTAVGRYQVLKGTLESAVQSLKLDPNTPFNEGTQDIIFKKIISDKKTLQGFISGENTDEISAVMDLALTFASVGVPRDVKKNEFGKYPVQDIKKGQSMYSGVAENKANISPEKALEAIKNDKINSLALKLPSTQEQPMSVDVIKPVTIEPKTGEQLKNSSQTNIDTKTINDFQKTLAVVNAPFTSFNFTTQQDISVRIETPKSEEAIMFQKQIKYIK